MDNERLAEILANNFMAYFETKRISESIKTWVEYVLEKNIEKELIKILKNNKYNKKDILKKLLNNFDSVIVMDDIYKQMQITVPYGIKDEAQDTIEKLLEDNNSDRYKFAYQ